MFESNHYNELLNIVSDFKIAVDTLRSPIKSIELDEITKPTIIEPYIEEQTKKPIIMNDSRREQFVKMKDCSLEGLINSTEKLKQLHRIVNRINFDGPRHPDSEQILDEYFLEVRKILDIAQIALEKMLYV